MLALIVASVVSLPKYTGPTYHQASRMCRGAEVKGCLPSSVMKDARKRLQEGSYLLRMEHVDVQHKCEESYGYVTCSVGYSERITKPRVYSYYMCKGCPDCVGRVPCMIWPCDSGVTGKGHSHTGSSIWFPEKAGCPFLQKRSTPVVVQEEERRTTWEDTCIQYREDPKYVCMRQGTVDNVSTLVYRYAQSDTCKVLKDKGCVEESRQCVQKEGDFCVRWSICVRCREEKEVVEPMPTFVVEEGRGRQEAKNNDMGSALSFLIACAEGARSARIEKDNIRVFSGFAMRCHVDIAQFRDCCQEMDGWGRWFGCGCSDEERQLARMRFQNRCVYVGEHISDHIIGIDARKQKVFCCFPHPLIKLLQVHAHKDLHISWGQSVKPECQGLKVTGELDRVDFSTLDEQAIRKTLAIKHKEVNYDEIKKKVICAVDRVCNHTKQ